MERQGFLKKWSINGNPVVHWGNCTLFHRVTEFMGEEREREQTGLVRRYKTLKTLLENGLILQVMEIIE